METYKKLDYFIYISVFLVIANYVSQIFFSLPNKTSQITINDLLGSTSSAIALITGALSSFLGLALLVILIYHSYRSGDYVSLTILPLIFVLDLLIPIASFYIMGVIAVYYIRLRPKIKGPEYKSKKSRKKRNRVKKKPKS